MSTVPAEVHGPSDAELIESVRQGTVSAYGSLYERHVGAAYNLARQLTRNQAEADDLVSEAFAKVLDTLRAGRGPDSAFRAYLLTALRHTAYDKTRKDRKVELSDDVTTIAGAETAVPFSDTAVAGLERSLAARAFARLPERWQAVLWHTEVEGQSPAEVAPILGLTPNGVSALAYRAREGLRQAYLQVHLAESDNDRCRATAERLGAWTRGGLSKRETAQVEAHLDECARCRALAAELADVNGGMRGIIAPLVLGAGALGYLATTAKVSTAAVVGTAAAAGAGGGAAAGAASSIPRQFIGVAVSATALAAAIAIALTAGTSEQQIPAAQQPPPSPTAPARTQPNNPPPPPIPPVPPPPQSLPNQPVPPTGQPPAQTPPVQVPTPGAPPPPAPPQPAPPSLNAPSPGPVTLVPGTTSELPFTVTNNGGSVSEPVVATLNLPPGISSEGPARMAGAPILRLNAAAADVACPAGSGTVTCSSAGGLQPGESVKLVFRLLATDDSIGGEITGSVMAGSIAAVKVSVKVDVQPPVRKDGVSILASPDPIDLGAPGLRKAPSVFALARNTGESTKQITVTFDETAYLVQSVPHASCTTTGATTSCVTDDPVKPGDRFYLRVKLKDWDEGGETRGDRHDPPPWHTRKVHVTATLGTASASTTVNLPWWRWPLPPKEPKPPTTTTKPTPPTQTDPTKPTQTTGPTKPTEPTKPTSTSSSEPPAVTTTPTTRTTTSERPPPDPCAGMNAVERLLADLTGQCGTGPGPR
ncbi:sigma-70 family RNA polymerase sigma factor [Actinocrispum sp. NPDC049592]|uniref:sigma-70 family RNA polymerase sigma factor n=1 Tax=Actinocrispum sp. NPDC049592 TaxID=3154835 RepID=UPI00342CDA5C